MLQAISAASAQSELFNADTLTLNSYSQHTESEESIMDKADFVAASTQKRLTHEQVFGALRGKLHAE